MQALKPHGWRWESTRHGLAARGVKTKSTPPHRVRKELLIGGRADNVPDRAFDPIWLKKGTKHELEHTRDPRIAKEIAKDHLAESTSYYKDLDEMEKKKRYHMTKERAEQIASTLKNMVSDGMPEGTDYAEYLRKRDTDVKRNDVVGKLDKAMDEGRISASDRKEALETIYGPLEREHLGKITASDQFNEEVDRKIDGFIRSRDRKTGLFG